MNSPATKLSFIEKITLSFVSLFILLGVFLAHWNHGYFKYHYVVEDGLIESMTVFALAGCSLICFYRLWVLRQSKNLSFLVFLFLMGSFFFFAAGEELSWGQRIFNIESHEFFVKHNAQQETNLHNLVVNGTKLNKLVFSKLLMLFAAFYLLIMPVLYRKKARIKAFIDNIAIPVAQRYQILAVVILLILTELSFSSKKGELLEFGGTFLMLLILINPRNKAIYQR